MRSSLIILALAGSSLLTLSACGSDDDSGGGIYTREDWCDGIGEVDDLLAEADSIDDFAEGQAVYEEVNGQVEDLIDGVDVVDESVRTDVTATFQWVADLTAALSDAPDEAAAEAALTPFFESFPGEEDSLGGATWILGTCGVDIND